MTNGEVHLNIEGKTLTVKFGIRAFKLIQQHSKKLGEELDSIPLLLWAGLHTRRKDNDLPAEFFDLETGVEMCLGWYDELSDEQQDELWAAWREAKGKMEALPQQMGVPAAASQS